MSYVETSSSLRWGLFLDKTNKLDGRTAHLIYENRLPVLFRTRREAREYANKRFGYIKTRPDLRREPFCDRMPKPVRVRVVMELAA
jgi:hypothetical protein